MSTTVEQSRQYAEFDEYIDFQLHRLRAGIRMNDVFTALCGVAVIVTAYLLGFVVLDHWVVDGGFSHLTRLISMLFLVAGTAAWVGLRVVRPCLRRVNRLYAARVAEAASTEIDSNLLNYEDLRRAGRDIPAPILKSLEKRAAVALSQTDVDDAIDRRLLLRLSVTLLTAVLVFCLYTVFSPKKVWPSIWRAVNPVTSTQVATQTEIVDVQPGNKADVLARTLLEVTVDLRGELPETVELVYSTLDRSLVDERVTLRRADETLKRFACVLAGSDGDGLLQGLTYHIEAGDAVSPPYRIDVIQPPSVSVEQIHYAFPDYMELRPERRESPGIDTWEGARLTFSASTNMPVKRAWIEFSDAEAFPLNPEPLPMEIEDGTRLSAEWQAMSRDDGLTPRFYRIRCRTEAGASDPVPAIYPIEIHPDEKPQIESVYPTSDLERPANAIVPLLLRASDPDFRLSRVTLRSRHGTIDLSDHVLWRGNERSAEVEHELRLEELALQPGDVLTWWGEARDNRVIDSVSRRLRDNNVSITPQLRIRIAEPVSEAEVVKQQAFDEQQRQERMDELKQEARGSNEPESGEDSADRGTDEAGDPERQPDDKQPSQTESDPDKDGEQNPEQNQQGDGDAQAGSSGSKAGDQSGKGTGEGSKSESEPGESTDREQSKDGDSGSTGKPSPDGKSPPGDNAKGGAESENGQRGEGKGSPRPVSNDGSDDDQVLRELLQKQKSEQPSKTGDKSAQAGDKSDQTDDNGESGKPSADGAAPQSKDAAGGQDKTGSDRNDGQTEREPGESPRENGDSTDRDPAAKGENTRDGSNPKPQSKGDNAAGGKSEGTADSESASQPGKSGNDANSTPSGSDAKQSGKDGGSTQKPDATANGGDKDQSPANSDPSGTEGKGDPAAGDSPENAAKPGSNSDSSGKPNGRESTGKSGGQSSSNDSASGSAGKSGGKDGQAGGSKSGSSSGKSGGDSSGKSGDGSGQSKGGDSAAGSGKAGSKSGSSSQSEGGKSTADGGSAGEEKPADGDQPSADGSADGKPGDEKPSPNGSGSGKGGGEPQSETGGDADSKAPKGESGKQSGKPQQQGSGDKKSDGQSSSDSGGQSQSGKDSGASSGGDQPGGNQPGKPSSGGKGNGSTSSNQGQSPSSQGRPAASDQAPSDNEPMPGSTGEAGGDNAPTADPVNVEDRLKATNLVLKQLQDDLDRGKVDQQLLDKLGWTEDDMRRFAERLESRLSADAQPADPGEAARTRQFREMLKSLDLNASSRERSDTFDEKQSTTDFSDLRERVPQKYRGAFEKYLDKLARQKRNATR